MGFGLSSPAMPRTAPSRAASAVPGTYELGQLIVQTRRQIGRRVVRELEAIGEAKPTWERVAQLHRIGDTCQRELARSMAIDPSRVSRLLEALEADGTVERRRDSQDRRKVTVGLTAQGRRRFARMRPLVLRAMEQTLAPLDPASRLALAHLLSRCAQP